MDQEPKPVKRMSDIGRPRRPLDLRAPASIEPAAPAPVRRLAPSRPAAPAQARPAATPLRPTAAPRPAASARPAAQTPSPVTAAPAKKGGAWKTVLQFIIGAVIIVLVAFSIVVLYIKYYAG